LRDRKATKIINKDNWIPEQEKILKKPNEYEAGVLNTQFCCFVPLSSSFEEKGPLILHQFPFQTNFNQQLFNHTHTHTRARARAYVSDLTVIAPQNCFH